MPLLTSHTDQTLAEYMRSVLQGTATTLGWTAVPHAGYTAAIHETLRAYGLAAVVDALDVRRLEALARREVWRAAMAEMVNRMNVADDGQSASLAQLFDHARAMFIQANADVAELPELTGGSPRRSSTAHVAEVFF